MFPLTKLFLPIVLIYTFSQDSVIIRFELKFHRNIYSIAIMSNCIKWLIYGKILASDSCRENLTISNNWELLLLMTWSLRSMRIIIFICINIFLFIRWWVIVSSLSAELCFWYEDLLVLELTPFFPLCTYKREIIY